MSRYLTLFIVVFFQGFSYASSAQTEYFPTILNNYGEGWDIPGLKEAPYCVSDGNLDSLTENLENIQAISSAVDPYKSDAELEIYRAKFGHCLSSADRSRTCYKGLAEIKKRCFDKDEVKHTLMPKEKAYLKKLAKIFDIPHALLYCTFFIESRFKPHAYSRGVGAQGVAQLMPGTINTLKVVYTTPSAQAIKGCEKPRPQDVAYCKKILQRKEYAKKWDYVEKALIDNGIIQNSLPIKCDPYAVYCGMTLGVALYHYFLNDLRATFPKLKLDVTDFQTIQMLMPTYNAGHGVVFSSTRVKAIQMCQKNNRLIPGCVLEKLEDKYKSNPRAWRFLKEPINYTKGISNCVQKDNYYPPVKNEVELSCQ